MLVTGANNELDSVFMKEIGIGLLGLGTVGTGVARGLLERLDLVSARVGVKPVLCKIADIDVKTDRGLKLEKSMLTTDAGSVIDDPDIDLVVELIGGTTVAGDLVTKALKLGKPVVTANKALLAERGPEIFSLAKKKNTDIYFEASVCGAIPVIRALRDGLVADNIKSVRGIFNGTCNYILTRMEQSNMPFADALKEAQAKKFAEADPSLDIDGYDTAHKAVIMASLAYGFNIPWKFVHVEGIGKVEDIDIRFTRDLGYRIKLLGMVQLEGNEVDVRVHPTLIKNDNMLASVGGPFNAVMVEGDLSGKTFYYGQGAGRNPTSSAVLGDIAEAVEKLAGCKGEKIARTIRWSNTSYSIKPIKNIETACYLRFSLFDRPGVLAKITSVLGRNGISTASVLQKDSRLGEYGPVVIVTHRALEKSYQKAIREIDAMSDLVGAETVRFRIDEEQ